MITYTTERTVTSLTTTEMNTVGSGTLAIISSGVTDVGFAAGLVDVVGGATVGTFLTDGVQSGDIAVNTSTGEQSTISNALTEFLCTLMGGNTNAFLAAGDNYEIRRQTGKFLVDVVKEDIGYRYIFIDGEGPP